MNKISKILGISVVFPAILCSSCNTTKKTDWESYAEILQECISDRDFHSQLYIFPKSIEGKEIIKFVFSNTTDLLNGSWLMYLGLKWDQEGFNEEISRLESIKAVYDNGLEKPIIKFEEQKLFLTIMKDNRYEYALYNSDTCEIIYVSNQLYEWKDVPVEEEHILPDVSIPQELDDGDNTYNMYYRYEEDAGWEVVD